MISHQFFLGTSVLSLIIVFMLIMVFIKRNVVKTWTSRVYLTMLFVGLASLITEIVCHFVYMNINQGDFFAHFIMRAYYISLLSLVGVFNVYVYLVNRKTVNLKLLIPYSIVFVIISALIIILPASATINGDSYYVDGPSLDVLLLSIFASLIYWVYRSIRLSRLQNVDKKQIRPIVFITVLFIVIAIVQSTDKSMLIADSSLALALLYMYFNIENPDRKSLEVISDAKRATDKANRSLEQMNKTKDEFMSLASHQLRTPLTSIRGYSSMLVDGDMGKLNDAQKHAMKEIENSSERMIFLVRDFLNVSRIQAGNFVLTRIKTNLVNLLHEDIEQLQSIADDHKVTLVIKLPKDPAEIPELNIDRERIGEIMANLIDNAIFYSHTGKRVEVSLAKINNTVEFRVVDHGIGVPAKEQSELFTKFFRGSNAKTIRPDGTGIGLFLVQKVIKEHGGKIIFHSVQGKGSTFGFSLPIDEVKSDKDSTEDEPK